MSPGADADDGASPEVESEEGSLLVARVSVGRGVLSGSRPAAATSSLGAELASSSFVFCMRRLTEATVVPDVAIDPSGRTPSTRKREGSALKRSVGTRSPRRLRVKARLLLVATGGLAAGSLAGAGIFLGALPVGRDAGGSCSGEAAGMGAKAFACAAREEGGTQAQEDGGNFIACFGDSLIAAR